MFKKDKTQKNNETSRRRYSLLLAALLLFSLFGYTTFSYLTDTTHTGRPIELSTGSVTLSADDPEGWRYNPENGHVNTLGKAGSEFLSEDLDMVYAIDTFSNLRPGDRFVQDIEVEYTGTLEASAIVTFAGLEDANNYFAVNAYLVEDGTRLPLGTDEEALALTIQPGHIFNIEVEVGLPILEAEQPGEGRNGTEWSMSMLKDLIEITVVQSNVSVDAGTILP